MKLKKRWITFGVILAVIAFAVIVTSLPKQSPEESTAKCIGENSALYVQLGCHACAIQEELFGENTKYLNIIDCLYNREICIEKNILHTPTWIINGEKIEGVQSINTLKELTGCE